MTRTLTFREAINEAMRLEMRRDPTVILMGEDVAGGAATHLVFTGDIGRPGLPLLRDPELPEQFDHQRDAGAAGDQPPPPPARSLTRAIYWIFAALGVAVPAAWLSTCRWPPRSRAQGWPARLRPSR